MIILNKKNKIWLFIIYNYFLLTIANKINIKEFENDMLKAVAAIIKSCQIYDQSSILIAGKFNYNDIQLLPDIKLKIMRSSLELLKQPTEKTIESLIISTDFVDHLTKFFMQIIHSSIWDRLKYTIILNKSTMDNNCDKYFSYLHAALQYDIINTIFLCITSSKEILLYTSNPYISWAPAPWKIDKKQWNHTQSGYIYTTQYNPNTVACEDLFFDKTRRLDQYSGIGAAVYVPLVFSKQGIHYNYKRSPKKVFDYKISRLLLHRLNVSISSSVSYDYGTFDELGHPYGVEMDVVDSKFDILFDSRFLVYTNDSVQSSSILGETGVTFVSHYRANVSTIMRIIHYFRPIIMFFSILVLGITIAILKISINESFSIAAMEVFRLFFNGPLLRVPNRQSPRIYIFTIFIFILVMQTIFRSKILSFIMVPESNNLETFADLANHKEYTIYCKKGFDFFLTPEIKKRCHPNTFYEPVANETKQVLIWDQYSNIGMTYKYNMHHSKEVLAKHYITFSMRRNWPLAKRVNEIFVRFFESGISTKNLEWAQHYVKILNYHLIKHEINSSRTLNLQDLDFAFQTLAFGLILACIMFLIETKCWDHILQYFNRTFRVLKYGITYCCTNQCKKNYV